MQKTLKIKLIGTIKNTFQFFQNLLKFLQNVLNEKQFLYISCILVAISSALAVLVLKSFAHQVLLFATYLTKLLKLPYANSILPIIGILLTLVVVRKFLNGSIQKGTAQIMIAVAKKSGIMPKKQMYSQIITSSLTVGMGGSAGLESPITITGAAFGSNFAQYYNFSYKNRTLLLACGVAAGISTAFNAPIAGVLFAIEVVLADMSVTAFIPLLLSSATGSIIGNLLIKEHIILRFKNELDFDYSNTLFYVLLGILGGFLAVYHARMFRKVEGSISKKFKNPYVTALVGSALLAFLIFVFPSLFGEGYESISVLASDKSKILVDNTLLESFKSNEWLLLGTIVVIMMIKSVATGLTLGSGGNGGNFAPSLFVGSYLGFSVSKFFQLIGFSSIPLQNFTVVGMAAVLSGLFHAPLTAVFLIAEITGGYGLIVPLMIVSSISFAISKRYDKYSMDIYAIADKGIVFTNDKDSNILNKIDIYSIMNKDIKYLHYAQKLDDAKSIFQNTNQTHIPVLGDNNEVIGEIAWSNFKSINLDSTNNEIQIALIHTPAESFSCYTNARLILDYLDKHNLEHVYLTNAYNFVGTISKERIMDQYRINLKNLRIE